MKTKIFNLLLSTTYILCLSACSPATNYSDYDTSFAAISGTLKDFFTAMPGDANNISSLSSAEINTYKPRAALTRIQAMVVPKDNNNNTFTNFDAFNNFAQDPANINQLTNIFRQIKNVIDGLELNTKGYRMVFDEVPTAPNPFNFKIYGGEHLGDTVQLSSGDSVGAGPGLFGVATPYNATNAFSSYFNETSTVPSYSILSAGTKKAMIFDDINPDATVHMQAIPKAGYVSSYDFYKNADGQEIQALLKAINKIISDKKAAGIGAGNFRMITNAGQNANQSVPHFHVHVLRGDGSAAGSLGKRAIPRKWHRKFKSLDINEVLSLINQETLVVFDVDETLAWVPGHTGISGITGHVSPAQGADTKEMWDKLLNLTNNTNTNMSAKYIALTARPAFNIAGSFNDALQNLTDIHLAYDQQWIAGNVNLNPSLVGNKGYKNKVLYAAHSNKGTVLNTFLAETKAAGLTFSKVVFADDNITNINNMVAAMMANPDITSSISFHYRGMIHPTSGATYTLIQTKPINATSHPIFLAHLSYDWLGLAKTPRGLSLKVIHDQPPSRHHHWRQP